MINLVMYQVNFNSSGPETHNPAHYRCSQFLSRTRDREIHKIPSGEIKLRHYLTGYLICLFQISVRSLPKVSKQICPYRDGKVNNAYLIKRQTRSPSNPEVKNHTFTPSLTLLQDPPSPQRKQNEILEQLKKTQFD